MKLRFAMVAGAVSLLSALSGQVRAATYDVTFTGSVYDLNVVVTTAGDINAPSGSLITGVLGGTLTGPGGGAITGIIPTTTSNGVSTYYAPSGQGWYYDNLLFGGSTVVDSVGGPLFQAGTFAANLYAGGPSGFYLSVDAPGNTGGLWNPGDAGTASVSAVPLPGGLSLFGAGLVALGAISWKKKKAA